jgi:hypothetical protein
VTILACALERAPPAARLQHRRVELMLQFHVGVAGSAAHGFYHGPVRNILGIEFDVAGNAGKLPVR